MLCGKIDDIPPKSIAFDAIQVPQARPIKGAIVNLQQEQQT